MAFSDMSPDSQDQMMVAEIRHRLANSYQLITSLVRTQIRCANGNEARERLNWVMESVMSLADLQRILSQPDGGSFGIYMQECCYLWQQIWSEQGVSVHVTVADGPQLSGGIASNLALIMNELMTNCMEHAFTGLQGGRIDVSLGTAGPRRGVLTVSDDGRGLAPAQMVGSGYPAASDSMGLALVEALTKAIGGRWELLPRDPKGTVARVEFPC